MIPGGVLAFVAVLQALQAGHYLRELKEQNVNRCTAASGIIRFC